MYVYLRPPFLTFLDPPLDTMSTSVWKGYADFKVCKFNKVAIFNGIVLIQVACSSLPCTLSLYNAFMSTVSVKAGQSELNEARVTILQRNKHKNERTNTSRDLLKFIYSCIDCYMKSTYSLVKTLLKCLNPATKQNQDRNKKQGPPRIGDQAILKSRYYDFTECTR